jgi:hypothetical protein
VLYAGISAYWGLGGAALLGTVGGAFQRAGEQGGAGVEAVVWLTVLLKLLAAGLGPVAVSERLGTRRRRHVRAAAWVAAVILTLYGGVLSIAGWLVQLGVIAAAAHADHRALRWHAFLWDPWFLAWGVLLAVALSTTRARARRPAPIVPR